MLHFNVPGRGMKTSRDLLSNLLVLLGMRTYVLLCPHSDSPVQARRKCIVN